jgi:hypothetical protein
LPTELAPLSGGLASSVVPQRISDWVIPICWCAPALV